MKTATGTRPYPGAYSRELLIDSSFQLKFGLILAGVAVVTSALTAFTVLVVRRQAHSTFAVIAAVGVILACAILIVLAAIVISHRLVGPLFVMTGFLTKLTQGNYPAVRPIRGDDELQEFYALFTSSIETLKARELEEIFKLQEATRVFAPLAVTADTRASLDNLRSMLERKRASVGSTKQEDPFALPPVIIRN